MKNIFLIQLIVFSIVFCSCRKDLQEIQLDQFKEEASSKNNKNKNLFIITNGDFDKRMDFNDPKKSYGWTMQAYLPNSAIINWDKKFGRNNTGGILIETGGNVPNDIALTQTITLDPNKFYRLSAWIKTENVADGAGANICLYGTWTKSESVTGTDDWQKIELDIPPGSKEITIGCRLGYWAGTSTGKAYFDDVFIEELDKFVSIGQHVQIVLDKEDASTVSGQTITSWIANLDKAYEKYYELMGDHPYNGDRITILSTNTYPGGWAVAGNPILWYKPYVQSELKDIATTGTWSFGILHELGHDFVLENSNKNWIVNEEMFANFRMYFVAEKLNANILQQGKLYQGGALENYYKTDAPESYANGLAQRIPRGYDGLMYTLIRIKNEIGWAPFIKTIRDLNASTIAPGTRSQMFYLFLDKLSFYSGQDVRNTYPAGELNLIEQLLN